MQTFEEREIVQVPVAGRLESSDDVPTTTLIKEAVDDAKRLIQLEVALARNEVKREIKLARGAAVAFGVSAVVAVVGAAMFFVAIALAFSSGPVPALIIGAILLFLAGCAALVGMGLLPKQPLGETRQRLESDVRIAKEHLV
jgi:Putative Actinobacterial Holin-X, holin superfamily III